MPLSADLKARLTQLRTAAAPADLRQRVQAHLKAAQTACADGQQPSTSRARN